MNIFIQALVKSLSYDDLALLVRTGNSELTERLDNANGCGCGAGYCPVDNLHYPCVCEPEPEWNEDELPF